MLNHNSGLNRFSGFIPVIFFLFVIIFSNNLYALGATIRSADMVVVGFNGDDNSYSATTGGGNYYLKRFALLAVNDIPGNSVIFITDRGWRDNTFMIHSADFTIKFTVAAEGIPAGTIIRFDPTTTPVVPASLGTAVDNSHVARTDDGRAGLSLTSTGDQIFIYQTADDTRDGARKRQNSTMTGVESGFIYCFNADNYGDNNNDGWSDNLTSDSYSRSEFPNLDNMTIVTAGSAGNAYGIFMSGVSEQDNLRYNGPTTAANMSTWVSRIHTPSNWSMDNGTPYNLTAGAISNNFSVLDPFPVELTSFSASVNNSSVNLAWETATEINNYGFEVQKQESEARSQNSEWEQIGFIRGNGNSNSPKLYSFVDETVSSGNYEYRLKQIDNDGSFEYSSIVEVIIGLPEKFSLEQNYPNPFNPSTKISYTIPEAGYVQLKVYNVQGAEVATLINENKPAGKHITDFNAENLSSGIYFYTLLFNGNQKTNSMILLR